MKEFFFEENFLMKKKAITVIIPKLPPTAMTKTKIKSRQSLRGITLYKEDDDCLSLNKKFLNMHAADSSTTSVCTRAV
jgi:hypothetical protein